MRNLLYIVILIVIVLLALWYFDVIQLGSAGQEALDAAEQAIDDAVGDGEASE